MKVKCIYTIIIEGMITFVDEKIEEAHQNAEVARKAKIQNLSQEYDG
jgi:hypothetical protein